MTHGVISVTAEWAGCRQLERKFNKKKWMIDKTDAAKKKATSNTHRECINTCGCLWRFAQFNRPWFEWLTLLFEVRPAHPSFAEKNWV